MLAPYPAKAAGSICQSIYAPSNLRVWPKAELAYPSNQGLLGRSTVRENRLRTVLQHESTWHREGVVAHSGVTLPIALLGVAIDLGHANSLGRFFQRHADAGVVRH